MAMSLTTNSHSSHPLIRKYHFASDIIRAFLFLQATGGYGGGSWTLGLRFSGYEGRLVDGARDSAWPFRPRPAKRVKGQLDLTFLIGVWLMLMTYLRYYPRSVSYRWQLPRSFERQLLAFLHIEPHVAIS